MDAPLENPLLFLIIGYEVECHGCGDGLVIEFKMMQN